MASLCVTQFCLDASRLLGCWAYRSKPHSANAGTVEQPLWAGEMVKTYPFKLDPFQAMSVACIVSSRLPRPLLIARLSPLPLAPATAH